MKVLCGKKRATRSKKWARAVEAEQLTAMTMKTQIGNGGVQKASQPSLLLRRLAVTHLSRAC